MATFVDFSASVCVTENLLSILLRIVPPFLIRWCNLLAGRAVGQPYSTIQKNVKKFGRFKKNTFLCIVTNIKNMEQKSFVYFGVLYIVSRVRDTDTCFRVYSSSLDKEIEFFSKDAIFLFGLLESRDLHAYNAAKSYFVDMFIYLYNV